MTRFLLFVLTLLTIGLNANFTTDADALLKRYVTNGTVDYRALKASGDLEPLVAKIAATDPTSFSGNDRKAYLVNAYNLLVIDQAVRNYPLQSVLDVSGFFDAKKVTVGGRRLTLNQLEKDLLLKPYQDARLHFVLVCGALGCPPITDFAYTGAGLEAQLERQTRRALNDATFIRTSDGGIQLSQIFDWYKSDFGGSKSATVAFINGYREDKLSTSAPVSFYTYNWTLNARSGATGALSPGALSPGEDFPDGGANNAARYVVSATVPRGTAEIKIFNNLYQQDALGERADFFTSTLSALYGVSDRFNAGLEARWRRASYDNGEATTSRSGLVSIGPKVRIAPFEQLPNFSVQSALWIPLGDDLTGAATGQRFLDWDGPTWFTQFFNDFPIGDKFSAFAEVDVLLEDIGAEEDGRINRFSTPVTGIFSFFPTQQLTLYGLASYSPFWQEDFDYFYQVGGGVKYQFTPKFELELLATAFDNEFLSSVGGTASTLNLGVRVNL